MAEARGFPGAFLMKHIRWHSPARRVLIDSRDLRAGIFYVKGHSAWLHLPGIVIRLKSPGPLSKKAAPG